MQKAETPSIEEIDSFRSMAFFFFLSPLTVLHASFSRPPSFTLPVSLPPPLLTTLPSSSVALFYSRFFIANKFCQLIAPRLSPLLRPLPPTVHFSLIHPSFPRSPPPPRPCCLSTLAIRLRPSPLRRSPFPSCWPQCLLCHCLSIFLCLH